MRGLSLTQPWATLVAIGAKRIETRSWWTEYRGPLVIHAAKAFPRVARAFADTSRFIIPLRTEIEALYGQASWPLGAIVAMAELDEIVPMAYLTDISAQERAFGDYSPGRFAWRLTDVRPLREPILATGALGVWTVSSAIAEQVKQSTLAGRTPA